MLTKRERILFILLYLLPFIDMINGFLIRKKGISGIGSAFHLLLLVTFLLITYFKSKVTFGQFEKYALLLLTVFLISGLINSIIINDFQPISLERVEKIITNTIIITAMYRLVNGKRITQGQLNKLLIYICFVVSVVTLIANFLHLGNYTYEISKLGMIGFFTGSNEPVAVFVILNAFLVFNFYEKQKLWYLIPFSCLEIDLIYVQSKSSYMYALLFVVILICIQCQKILKRGRVNKYVLLLGIPGIFLVAFAGKNLFLNTISNFINRQSFIKTAYGNTGFLNYISSGRIARIENLVGSIFDRNFFIMCFQVLFGQGLNFEYIEIIEIDVLDAFLYGGLLGASIIMMYMIAILNKINKSSKLILILTLLIYLYSFMAGHIWTGGISGIYFALVLVYFMNEKWEENQ